MTNSPRWDEGRRPQQGGWNDDDRRSSDETQWNADRPRQPQQREWSAGSANRAAPGYAPVEPSRDWGNAAPRGHDDWRSPGSQGFAAGYGMGDGDNYDDRFSRHGFGGAGGASNPGYGRGYGPDYGRDSGEMRGGRGFLARAGDEIASWFGDEDAAQRREQDYRGHGPADYTRSDERIREDVNDRLTDDPRLNARQISVAVKDGEVTLNGTVTSRGAKRRAEDCIDWISGVKHVQNNLRVTQGSGALNAAGTPRDTITSRKDS